MYSGASPAGRRVIENIVVDEGRCLHEFDGRAERRHVIRICGAERRVGSTRARVHEHRSQALASLKKTREERGKICSFRRDCPQGVALGFEEAREGCGDALANVVERGVMHADPPRLGVVCSRRAVVNFHRATERRTAVRAPQTQASTSEDLRRARSVNSGNA